MIENASILFNEEFLKLLSLPKKFYVTGSRYFGGVTENSDYDFFVQDDEEIHEMLKGLGYDVIQHHDYANDKSITYVYEKISYYRNETHKIQIQVVKDAELKYEVQKFLKRHFHGGLPGMKMDRSALWDIAFLAYETWIKQRKENVNELVGTPD